MGRKKKKRKKNLQIFTQWITFITGSHRCQISVGQQLEKKIAVGSEPMLAFLLQFVRPIRKQLKTHGKLEKNSSIQKPFYLYIKLDFFLSLLQQNSFCFSSVSSGIPIFYPYAYLYRPLMLEGVEIQSFFYLSISAKVCL